MIYIHELESVLSSNFLLRSSFSLLLPTRDPYHVFQTNQAMARNSHFARAFTLIEVIVVLAIIVIMMAMVYPAYTTISERAKATKDMSNLRQIGMATQAYLNDNDGVLFSPATPWSSQLELNQKYLSTWRILQSPFDKRTSSYAGDAATPISYGVNVRIYPNNTSMAATKITNPTGFILFAPAQSSAATVTFQGVATTGAPGVNLLGNNNAVTSTPGGVPIGGTHNSRRLINALFADLHCETMSWSSFKSTTSNVSGQPDQWTPYTPYP
jgi:prepilin-type N-terminal cleavage/methylation domain-containing protein/prepilin-type processing-associated H-X9-DG protein